MTTLQEIAGTTSPISMKKLLSGSSRAKAGESLISKLYKLLRAGKLEEEAIVTKLYGKGTTLTDGRYKTLKSRLKRIMLDSLLNEEVTGGGYSTYDQAYITGHRQLSLARILIAKRAYQAAKDVATQAFKSIRNYEILPLNEGFTDLLSSLYLGTLHNPALFDKYYEMHQYYAKAAYDLGVVTSKYRTMRSKVYINQDSPYEIGKLALGFTEETHEIMMRYLKVPPLQGMVRATHVMGLKLTGQYRDALVAADEAEEILSKCKGVSDHVISAIGLMRVECSLQLRDFEIGRFNVDRTRKLIPPYTINSIKLSEYAVLLGLHTGNYDYAYDEIVSLDRKTLQKLPKDRGVKENWLVLEAYIRLLIAAGKVSVRENSQQLESFRLAKFINNVPGLSANKSGTNIQILVLQAMFFIVRGELSKFIDRTDALDRYCNRYLKDNDSLRHNCFFRLLTEVVKGGFDLKSRKRKIKIILDRMTSPEAVEISKKTNSEIVPYEVLWSILTERISRFGTSYNVDLNPNVF
jgi:hypothetical protein